MKECWINVYDNGKMINYNSKEMALFEGWLIRPDKSLICRIHVKMKEAEVICGGGRQGGKA